MQQTAETLCRITNEQQTKGVILKLHSMHVYHEYHFKHWTCLPYGPFSAITHLRENTDFFEISRKRVKTDFISLRCETRHDNYS